MNPNEIAASDEHQNNPVLAAELKTEEATPRDENPFVETNQVNGFCKLDQRLVRLSRVVNAMAFGFIDLVAMIAGCVLIWFVPSPWSLVVLSVWLLLGVLTSVFVIWWPRWEYDGWSYGIGARTVELRFGVCWHVAVAIPLSRLQHIDLHAGPLERKFGLTSLHLHTAGTQDAVHRVPGLDVTVAVKLRDQLIDAARRGSHGSTER